jgi:hypothetical protein
VSEQEPRIWSNITDALPEDHPLAFKTLYCVTCDAMLHCGHNECMRTWVETGKGQHCLECFVRTVDGGVLEDGWGLHASDPGHDKDAPAT